MKIGVFVGSFDPVHKGHIIIINYLLEKYLDKVIVVPTGNYWNKKDLTHIYHRINMLKIYQNEKIIIDEENNELEYTYEVLDSLNKKYKEDELYLIIGADNIVSFDKWVNYQKLLNYNLIIINRSDINIKYYLNKMNKNDKYIITDELANINISSTFVRENIKNIININDKIDKDVIKYIKDNNLYI